MENQSMVDFHDAFDFRCVERINNRLPFSDLELRNAVGESGGDRGGFGEGFVVAKGVNGTTLGVLSDVVVAELTGCFQE